MYTSKCYMNLVSRVSITFPTSKIQNSDHELVESYFSSDIKRRSKGGVLICKYPNQRWGAYLRGVVIKVFSVIIRERRLIDHLRYCSLSIRASSRFFVHRNARIVYNIAEDRVFLFYSPYQIVFFHFNQQMTL